MLFSILSRAEAEQLPNDLSVPHVIISISDLDSRLPTPRVNEYTLGVLRLQFADLDQHPGFSYVRVYGQPRLFDHELATQIADFVASHDPMAVVVHCEMGVSRSAAVAAALSKFYNNDDSWVWFNLRYHPNELVYKTLLNVLRSR